MKKIILSALLFLPLFLLSACGTALPGEEVMQNLVNRSADLESYHQFVALTTTTTKEDLNGVTAVNEQYTTADATLFPEEKTGYGKRIDKNSDYPATKSEFYVTPEVGYIRTDDADWTAYATPDVPLASLQVYPLETFIELSQIIEEYGTLELKGDEYLLSFSGSDDASEQRAQLPIPNPAHGRYRLRDRYPSGCGNLLSDSILLPFHGHAR